VQITRLNSFIDIDDWVETRTSTGGVVRTPAVFAEGVPAEILPVSGREFFEASQQQSEVTTKITIRYLPGVKAKMRARCDDSIFNIAAVMKDRTRRGWMLLYCSEGVNAG